MAITMMTRSEKVNQPNVRIVTDYPGAETTKVVHAHNCPHSYSNIDRNDPDKDKWSYDFGPDCLDECHYREPLYMETTYKNRVIKLREKNGSWDSDFFATVWDDETNEPKEIEYASTRGWCYPNNAVVDADKETLKKYENYCNRKQMLAAFESAFEKAHQPEKGKIVRVIKGRKVAKGTTGEIFWTQWWERPKKMIVPCYSIGMAFCSTYGGILKVGIRDESGNVHWTYAHNCEVVDPELYY